MLLDALFTSMAEHQTDLRLVQADVIHSKAALTIHASCDLKADGTEVHVPPLQIMLTLYKDPLEVALNFDVDCCGVLYQPSTRKVLCTLRCQRALDYRTNILDTAFRGEHYEGRLEKYATSGFCVAVRSISWSIPRKSC